MKRWKQCSITPKSFKPFAEYAFFYQFKEFQNRREDASSKPLFVDRSKLGGPVDHVVRKWQLIGLIEMLFTFIRRERPNETIRWLDPRLRRWQRRKLCSRRGLHSRQQLGNCRHRLECERPQHRQAKRASRTGRFCWAMSRRRSRISAAVRLTSCPRSSSLSIWRTRCDSKGICAPVQRFLRGGIAS